MDTIETAQARYERKRAELIASLSAYPADLLAAILAVMKRHDGDDFNVGQDEHSLADLMDDLRQNGLRIVWSDEARNAQS